MESATMPKPKKSTSAAMVSMCKAHEAACRQLHIPFSDTVSRSRVAELILEQAALGLQQQHVLVQAVVLRFKQRSEGLAGCEPDPVIFDD